MATLERPGLLQLPVYHAEDRSNGILLDANERATNLPEAVKKAALEQIGKVAFNRYPDMGMTTLTTLLAEGLDVSPEEIVIGCGSSGLLEAACQAFGGPGRKIAYPAPSFSMYEVYARLAGSEPLPLALDADFKMDVPAVCRTITAEQPSLVILCNPNNPTGTVMTPEALQPLLETAACPVVVDEAYIEFSQAASVLPLRKQFPNLIIMRTFSKAYGLAAARVGYLTARTELTALLQRVLMPYRINSMSLVAAETVYTMRAAFAEDIQWMIGERQRLAQSLAALKLKVFPSGTNFLFVQLTNAQGATTLATYLHDHGIVVRDFSKAPLVGGLRITVGTHDENETLVKTVRQFMADRGNA